MKRKRRKMRRTETFPVRLGEGVTVEGHALWARWPAANLEHHYQRHPLGGADPREETCWQDLEGTRTVSLDAYEKVSFECVKDPVVHYRASDLRHRGGEVSDYFFDRRLVMVVTPDHRQTNDKDNLLLIISCFHKHRGGPYNHVRGEHRQRPLEQRVMQLEIDLTRREQYGDLEGLHFYSKRYRRKS